MNSYFKSVFCVNQKANVSMSRIRNFLIREEIDLKKITHQSSILEAVCFRAVDLGWDRTEKILNK